MLIIGFVLLPIAVLFVVAGWYGDLVGDHPHCRRCKFDLFGKPEGSTRCPECGADLTRRRAIRTGQRVRRWGVIVGGIIVLLGSGGFLAAGLRPRFENFEIAHYKPVWWLTREARSEDGVLREAAMAELGRRLKLNRLSDEQVNGLADWIVARQADPATPWYGRWGDFIEQARAANQLRGDRFQKYADQALHSVQVDLAVRPRVRRGETLVPAVLGCGIMRAGSGKQLSLGAIGRTVSLGSHSFGPVASPEWPFPLGAGGLASDLYGYKLDGAWNSGAVRDGPSEFCLSFDLALMEGYGLSKSLARRHLELRRPVEILPSNVSSVLLKDTPDLRRNVEAALRVRQADGYGGYISIVIGIDHPPCDLCYRAFTRVEGEKEYVLDWFVVRRGEVRDWRFSTRTQKESEPKRIDIVLRPAPSPASLTLDITEICGAEIQFRDVPIRRPTTRSYE
jgi:hypothetical protein